MTRSAGQARTRCGELGAKPVVADALDADQVARGRRRARARRDRPPADRARRLARHCATSTATFALTNRLRTEGTDHLLAAGRAVGREAFVAQSYAGWPYARDGGPVRPRTTRSTRRPPSAMRETLAAIRHLEGAVLGADWTEGIVLRYGGFYGPGHLDGAPDGEHVEMIRKRKFPVVGSGGGVWSFIHIDDAADGDGRGDRARRGAASTTSSTTSRRAVAEWLPGAGARARRQAAAARAALARAPRSPARRRRS